MPLKKLAQNIYPLVVLLLLTALFAGPSALARDLEITPSVGYRFGTAELKGAEACIGGTCIGADSAEDHVLGLAITVALNERWLVELRVSQQEEDLDFEIPPCPECLVLIPEGRLEQTTLLLGVERRFTGASYEPFVAFGAGISRLETTEDFFLPFPPFSEERPTLSVAGGVRWPVTRILSLRLEARGLFTDLPSEIAESDLTQFELSSGLTFKF